MMNFKKPLFLTILVLLMAGGFLLGMFSFVNAQAVHAPQPDPSLQEVDLFSGPTYAGELSLKSPKWNRVYSTAPPSETCDLPLLDHPNNGQAYQAIPFQVTNTAPITVTLNPTGTSLSDTVLLIYCKFSSLFPTKSGLAYDDNGGLGDLSAFTLRDEIRLQTRKTYWLIITTDAAEYGTYQIDFSENIRLGNPDPLTCNGGTVTFDYGPPPDWLVFNNHPDNPVEWSNLDTCGEAANYATGHGDTACASSDLQGSGDYDTYLFSNVFSLENVYTATLDYWSNYQNFSNGDFFVLEISTDGGLSWETLLSWNEDHGSFRATPGENVQVDLTPYQGYRNVQLRWHYFDPEGPVENLDWYVQLDDVSLECSYPSIELNKTVSVMGGGCPGEDTIDVVPGTDVEYCYEVINTGAVTFTLHTLTDSELGTIVSDFPFTLGPGESTGAGVGPIPIYTTTVNTGTWTASDPATLAEASDTDTAEVVVIPPSIVLTKTVSLMSGGCPGEDSIEVSPGTEVQYCYDVMNTGLTTFTLHTLTDSELGTIVSDFPFTLGPGESTGAGVGPIPIYTTTVTTGTWTASDPATLAEASDTDTAEVVVIPPSIVLTKTVTANVGVCPGSDSIEVLPGTDVSSCYQVMNTGLTTFTLHTLTDSELGTIVSDFPYTLGPGESTFAGTSGFTIDATTVTTGTWTAFNPGPSDIAMATDSATIYVLKYIYLPLILK